MRLLIIGAGPAGLSSAYWSLKNGHEVLVFEKDSKYNKVCGEAVPKQVFDLTPLKPKPPVICNEVKGYHIYFNGKHYKEIKSHLVGYILNKEVFINELEKAVEDEGGRILHRVKIVDLDHLRGKVIDHKGNAYSGDLIVDAGGHFSLTQRKKILNFKSYKVAPAAQCRCKVVDFEFHDPEKIHLNYYKDGYSWIFYKSEELVNLGLGRLRGNVKKELEEKLKSGNFIRVGDIKVDLVSIGGLIETFTRGKLRVAGEAAGMVFPHTGEGIRPAIYAGKLVFKGSYEKEFRKGLGKRIQRGKHFNKLLLEQFTEADFKELISVVDEKLAEKLFHCEKLLFNLKMLTKLKLLFKFIPMFFKAR